MLITPLKPREGSSLRVVLACRTTMPASDLWGCATQELRLCHWLSDHFDGPTQVQVITENSVGCSDIRQILKIVHGDNVDLVLAEDLNRITRRQKQIIRFLEECQLRRTRVIAIKSGFDTACSPL